MQQSISFPKDHLFIAVDDMDNSKSLIPRMVESGKRLSNLNKIDSKITGCVLTSGLYKNNRKVKFFVNHNEFENGSNKVVSVLFKLIKDFQSDHGFLPRTLILTADNCGRENKNMYLLSFLYALVELDIFEEVEFLLLLVGHTGNFLLPNSGERGGINV